MITTVESGQPRPKSIRYLAFAPSDYHHAMLRNFLVGWGDEIAPQIEEATSYQDLLQKIDQQSYDLVLIAHDALGPPGQIAFEELNRHSNKTPLLFLPESAAEPITPATGSGEEGKPGFVRSSDEWVSRSEQVIMNLAANARDAMPQGGRLTMTTRNVDLDSSYVQTHPVVPAGRYVLLEVEDSGEGIDPLHLPHIFEPFYTTKESGKGTGLGLATVYGIVKQSGGFIWVYSELGMGTTFKIYFPRVEAKARKPFELDTALDPSKLRGWETVLLVEDENAVRHPTVESLRQCGYTVIEAQNGLQAIDVAHKHEGPINLMVTDVVMPGMSGGQLAELLAEKYTEMKVLFVSGYSEQVVLRHKVVDLHTNFLQKPFTLKSLAAKVRQILDATKAVAAGAGQ